jgi:hypothetical protein
VLSPSLELSLDSLNLVVHHRCDIDRGSTQGPGKVMKLGRDLRCHNCRDVPGGSEGGGRGPGGTMEALTLTVVCHEGRPPAHAIFLPDGCCPRPVPS